MNIITIKAKKYYFANELKEKYPEIFKGCVNTRQFIRKTKVTKYIYVRKQKETNKWSVSDGASQKLDKVLLLKKWFDDTYLKQKDVDNEEELEEEEESEEESIEDKIEDAPNKIYLEDNEKFKDNDGNIIEIEVRGERRYDRCYFKVRDIMNGFGLNKLYDNITDKKRSGYKEGEHYKYFMLDKKSVKHIRVSGKNKKDKNKKLFLTYSGLMRVLFASQKKTSDKFIKWANETLFAAQMGTPDQKTELASNLLGASLEAVKQVFNKSARKIPCNYLFILGQVKDLRKSFKIDDKYDDDDYVSKWGMTIDLERRTKEHENDFGKIKGCKMQLYAYGFIDPQYISEAEAQLKNYMDGMDLILNHEKYEEIAIISKNKLAKVKNQITLISKTYMGHIAELIAKIKEKDYEIELMRRDNELVKKNYELDKKNHELDLMKKDLEIEKLKRIKRRSN